MKYLLVSWLLIFSQIGFAQDGIWDSSFGNNGLFTFQFGEFSARDNHITEISNGELIIFGRNTLSNSNQEPKGFHIYKLNPEGTLISDFGNAGIINFENGSINTKSIVYHDSKFLFNAIINEVPFLIKIDTNGNYDSSFGNNGFAELEDSGIFTLSANGQIYIVTTQNDGNGPFYKLSRHQSNGNLDNTFGNNGSITIDPTDHWGNLPSKIWVQSDNKIIISGMAFGVDLVYPGISNLIRLNTNGTFDTAFGNQGIVINHFNNYPLSEISDFTVQNDGKIIAVGSAYFNGGTGGFYGTKPLLMKYNSNGSLDQNFGDSGKIIIENTVFGANDTFNNLLIQPDAKILVSGTTSLPYPYIQTYAYITRFQPNGDLGYTFGTNAMIVQNFTDSQNNFSNYVEDIILLNDGKILIAGHKTNDFFFRETFLARYLNESLNTFDLNETMDEISIYPNPTNGLITIRNANKLEISLYSSIGQKLNFDLITTDKNEKLIDISGLPNGIYFLKIGTKTKKIIKQ